MNLPTSTSNLTPNLTQKIQEIIEDLIQASLNLREALLHRKAETIWEILAEKQEKLTHLEQSLQLWHQLNRDTSISSEQEQIRNHIRQLVSELQMIEQRNAHLANSYLIAIRRAFEHAGITIASQTKTYTKQGSYGKANHALIVKKLG